MEAAAAAAHPRTPPWNAARDSPKMPPQPPPRVAAASTPRAPLTPGSAATVAGADGSGGGEIAGLFLLAALGLEPLRSPWGATRRGTFSYTVGDDNKRFFYNIFSKEGDIFSNIDSGLLSLRISVHTLRLLWVVGHVSP